MEHLPSVWTLGETEGARRATGVSPSVAAVDSPWPDGWSGGGVRIQPGCFRTLLGGQRGRLSLGSQAGIEILEPVAAPADVEHVTGVEQSIENRGGQHFIAGEHLGPVAHAFV